MFHTTTLASSLAKGWCSILAVINALHIKAFVVSDSKAKNTFMLHLEAGVNFEKGALIVHQNASVEGRRLEEEGCTY